MESKPIISVITPTYNREKSLQQCYESLFKQTNYSFEWIIVDDGSTDNTEETVNEFANENFAIKYIKKENGGKHTALNASHRYINGEYVLILDSDDTLTSDAIDKVIRVWERYKDNKKVGVIIFLKGDFETKKPVCISSIEKVPVELLKTKRIVYTTSDCCEVLRAELFTENPFPEFKGEKFIAEGVLWNKIGAQYKCVYINDVIYLCEYRNDGLTKAGRHLRIHNPFGGMATAKTLLTNKSNFTSKIKAALLYDCYSMFANVKLSDVITESGNVFVTVICYIPAYILYKFWKKRYY